VLLVVLAALIALTARAAADASSSRASVAIDEADSGLSADRGAHPGLALEPAAADRGEGDADHDAPAGADPDRLPPEDLVPRRERPSRWGRLELSVVWRRTLDDAAGASRRDELWLLAIWSR
jgi:hypothetical protein